MIRSTKFLSPYSILLLALTFFSLSRISQSSDFSLTVNDREENVMTLTCVDINSGTPLAADYYRNPNVKLNNEDDIPDVSYPFEVTSSTEGEYVCQYNGINSTALTIIAIPVAQDVEEMMKDTWGERVTLQCKYRPGNYMSAYEVRWIAMLGGTTNVIDKDFMEPFSLNQMDFSLSVELNPFSVGTYQCEVTITTNSPVNLDLLSGPDIVLSIDDQAPVLFIKQPPQNSLITTETSTMFRCDADVSVNAKISFEIFDEEIVFDSNCNVNYTGVIQCNKMMSGHATELLCDYSQFHTVSCNFSVHDLTVNSSSVVTCFVREDQNEVNTSAALYVKPNPPVPNVSREENGDLKLTITLPTPPTIIPVVFNVTIHSNPSKHLTGNGAIDNNVVTVIFPETDFSDINGTFSVSYTIRFGVNDSPSEDSSFSQNIEFIIKPVIPPSSSSTSVSSPPSTPSPSSFSSSSSYSATSVPSTSTSLSSTSSITSTVTEPSPTTVVNSPVDMETIIIIVIVILVVIIGMLIISFIVLTVLVRHRKKGDEKFNQSSPSIIRMENGRLSAGLNGHYHYIPPDDISHVSTVDTYLGEPSPRHQLSRSSNHSSGRSHSSNNSSTRHLTAVPLPRYGIPDNQYNINANSLPPTSLTISDVPEITLITPTPVMEDQPVTLVPVSPTGTEPMPSVPNTPSGELDYDYFPNDAVRPRNLPIAKQSSRANIDSSGTTPLTDQTMIGVLLYLQHSDCNKKDTCDICKLIQRHFKRVAGKYGERTMTDMIKSIQTPGDGTLKQLRKREKRTLRSPYRCPPPLGVYKRQRSHSASHLDDEELTFSSTETEDEVSIKNRKFKGRDRRAKTDDELDDNDCLSLPLGQIRRQVLMSDPNLGTPITDTPQLPPSLVQDYDPSACKKQKSVDSDDSNTSSRNSNTDLGILDPEVALPPSVIRAQQKPQPVNYSTLVNMNSTTSEFTSSDNDSVFQINSSDPNTYSSHLSSDTDRDSINSRSPTRISDSSQSQKSHKRKHRHHHNHHDSNHVHSNHHHTKHHDSNHHDSTHVNNPQYSLDPNQFSRYHRKMTPPGHTLSPLGSMQFSVHSSPGGRYRLGSHHSSGSNQSTLSVHSESAIPSQVRSHQHFYSPPQQRRSIQNINRTPSPVQISLPTDDSSATPL